MYDYKAKIRRVIDGDTVDVDIDLGFGIWLKDQRIRINGIDTPESRTRDKVEKVFGNASKEFVKKWLPVGSIQVLITTVDKSGDDKRGKFGRILGDFQIEKTKLTNIMLSEGYAVRYSGGNKDDLKILHLKNRNKLIAEGKVNV
jgi:micrococcal nuclease